MGTREEDIATLSIAQARAMPEAELRENFIAIVSEIIAEHGREFLPDDFPSDFKKLTKAGMLELVMRHPDVFGPPASQT